MNIDITAINQNIKNKIDIDQDFDLDISSYETEIKKLKNMHMIGYIKLDSLRNVDIVLNVSGTMILTDAISLEDVEYDFTTEISENLEKNEQNLENSVDLFDILWQNIVLEVPLRFTKVSNLEEFKGEGWKLLDEKEEKVSNNPFEELKSMFGEE